MGTSSIDRSGVGLDLTFGVRGVVIGSVVAPVVVGSPDVHAPGLGNSTHHG